MIEIDQKQVQVKLCRFELTLVECTVPLRMQGEYFVQWHLKRGRKGVRTLNAPHAEGFKLLFQEKLFLQTEMLWDSKKRVYLRRDSVVSVHVISSSRPDQVKLVGSLTLQLEDVLNQRKYEQPVACRLSYSSMQAEVVLACSIQNQTVSSVLATNLDLSLFADQYVWRRISNKVSKCETGDHSQLSQIQQRVKSRIRTNGIYGTRDMPVQKEEYEEEENITENPSRYLVCGMGHLLVNRAAFTSYPSLSKLCEDDETMNEHLSDLQLKDLEQLVTLNMKLKRMLYRSGREFQRWKEEIEGDLRSVSGELSLRQVQLDEVRHLHSLCVEKIGELLEENTKLGQQIELILCDRDSVSERLTLQINVNLQLRKNYEVLERQIKQRREWQSERNCLGQKVTELQRKLADAQGKLRQRNLASEQVQFLRRQVIEVRQRQQQLRRQLNESSIEMQKKDQLLGAFQDRFSSLQQEIGRMENQDYVHRAEYGSFYQTKEKVAGGGIYIEEEGSELSDKQSLNLINEQENQDSIISIEEKLQSQQRQRYLFSHQTTSTVKDSSPSTTRSSTKPVKADRDAKQQLQLLRLLSRKLQAEYDDLLRLQKQQQEKLSCQRELRKKVTRDFQDLRYEFLCELSKVTAMVNAKVLENRAIMEQNIDLNAQIEKMSKSCFECLRRQQLQGAEVRNKMGVQRGSDDSLIKRLGEPVTVEDLIRQLERLQEQKLDYFTRCHRLEGQNQFLVRMNCQKEEFFELMMGHRVEEENGGSVQRCENIIQFVLKNQEKYLQLIDKYFGGGILKEMLHIKVIEKEVECENQKEPRQNPIREEQPLSKKDIFNSYVKRDGIQMVQKNLSELINNLQTPEQALQISSQSSQGAKRGNGTLLLESNAQWNKRVAEQSQVNQCLGESASLGSLVAELGKILEMREEKAVALKNLSSRFVKRGHREEIEHRLGVYIQELKKSLLEIKENGVVKLKLLGKVKEIESCLKEWLLI